MTDGQTYRQTDFWYITKHQTHIILQMSSQELLCWSKMLICPVFLSLQPPCRNKYLLRYSKTVCNAGYRRLGSLPSSHFWSFAQYSSPKCCIMRQKWMHVCVWVGRHIKELSVRQFFSRNLPIYHISSTPGCLPTNSTTNNTCLLHP